MALGTLASFLLGSTALVGTAGATTAASRSQSGKNNSAAQAATDKARKEAEQKALLEAETEEKSKKARASLLATPTSGYGPNMNLARSFLTTL